MTFKNAISWFEIPSTNLERAQRFYEAIFGIRLIPDDTAYIKMRMFPVQNMMEGISGAVVYLPEFSRIQRVIALACIAFHQRAI